MKKSKKILIFTGCMIFVVLLTMMFIYGITHYNFSNITIESSFSTQNNKIIVGDGKLAQQTKNLTGFSSINAQGWFNIKIKPGKQNKIEITTDENILPYVKASVTNDQLNLGIQSDSLTAGPDSASLACDRGRVRVENNKTTVLNSAACSRAVKSTVSAQSSKAINAIITAQPFHNMNLGGRINLQAKHVNTTNLVLVMEGNCRGVLQGDINNLKIFLGGKSKLHINVVGNNAIHLIIGGNNIVYLSGKTKNLMITSAGKAIIYAGKLVAENVTINGAGKQNIIVNAQNSLSVEAIGNIRVRYDGNPTNIDKTIIGASSVESINATSEG